jgi:hypothetical protein
MKDSRIGESLWSIWDGEGYDPAYLDSAVYYTETHVDLEEDVVRKALASSIQRDGISYSLSESFSSISRAIVSHGWVGTGEGELYQEICDPFGETISGAFVEDVIEVTFVEVPCSD